MSEPREVAFKRFGRSYHLRIATAEDLRSVLQLDEAHWVATGSPISTMSCDRTFLDIVDTDRNGRIMCFEIRDAIRWLTGTLRDHSGLTAGSTSLQLDAVNTGSADGRRIHLAARKILDRLGSPDAQEVSLQQVRRTKAQEEAASVSEAGVALPAASEDADVRQFLCDVIATVGGAPHPSGEPGVGQVQLGQFLDQARAHLDWLAKGEVPAGQDATDVMPVGTRTPDAFAIYSSLRQKVNQYFAQCRAVAFDPRAAERILPGDAELEAIDFDDPQAIQEMMRKAPLARPREDLSLRLEEGLNAYYAAQVARLRTEAIAPALGQDAAVLPEHRWREVEQFFAAHEAWMNSKAGTAVAPLGPEKLRRYLDGRFADAVRALIAESADTAFVLDNIRLLEKLVLYQAYLMPLVNNFVSFPHLYDESSRAMFEMGSLVMDGRRFNLAVRAVDRKQHSDVAKTSNMYVLYVEVMPPGGEQSYEVAVPVTSGGKGNLCVGKRGVFLDLAGRELDARVVQIIENPISLVEALASPFKRIGRLLSGKVEAITAATEKKLDTAVVGTVDQSKQPPPAQAGRGLMAGGLLMGGGVALAALGSAFAYIAKTLAGIELWQIQVALAVAVLAVVLPTSIVAFLKLRRRDLSAILEGSGWAINARMRLTFRQGRFFTRRPRYPKGARGLYREWLWLVVIVILLAAGSALGWYFTRSKAESKPQPTPATEKAPAKP